jgi:hypothetical protein
MHSERQIRLWFEEIRDNSYSDLCLSSKVHIKDMFLSGYSSPFNGNVYINLSFVNRYKLSKEDVIGILAHELAHQVSYRTRSFYPKILFLWNYWLSEKKRSEVEKEADEITVQRGYGKELLAERESEDRRHANNKKRLASIRRLYLGPDDIKKIMKRYHK